MAHSSELRWQRATDLVSAAAANTISLLNASEETYQELLEAYAFSGNTDQFFADQLFADIIAAEVRNPAVADPAEVAMVADLRTTIITLHELYLAMTNGVVATADRIGLLRRMS